MGREGNGVRTSSFGRGSAGGGAACKFVIFRRKVRFLDFLEDGSREGHVQTETVVQERPSGSVLLC